MNIQFFHIHRCSRTQRIFMWVW